MLRNQKSLCRGMRFWAGLLVMVVGSVSFADSWPMRQKDMGHTGRAKFVIPESRLDEDFFTDFLWQTPIDGETSSTSMSFYDGVGPGGADIVVGTYHWPKGVQGMDRHTGERFWYGNPDGGETIARITPAFSPDGSTIYVVNDWTGDPEHPLMAFDPAVGPSVKWDNRNDVSPSDLAEKNPMIAPDGRIFLRNWTGRVYGGTDSGSAISRTWMAETNPGLYYSDPALYDDGGQLKVICSGRNNHVYCYDGASGDELWSTYVITGTDAGVTVDPANGNIYVPVGTESIYMVGLDIDGDPLWGDAAMMVWEYDGWYGPQRAQSAGCLSFDGATYYFQTNSQDGDGMLFAINTADGSIKWIVDTYCLGWEVHSSSPIVTPNGIVIVGNNEGGEYFAVRDMGDYGDIIATYEVDLDGWADQGHAYASATLSEDGVLYLPLRTEWTVGNAVDDPDYSIRPLYCAIDVSGLSFDVGDGYSFATIQEAVDAAEPGTVITIHDNGANVDYYENVIINQNGISLIVAEGEGYVKLEAAIAGEAAITVEDATGVMISGLIILEAAESSGVSLEGAIDCTIDNLSVSNCLDGISVANSTGTTIEYLFCYANDIGIRMTNSNDTVVQNSFIAGNNQAGIQLNVSDGDNRFEGIEFQSNSGFGIELNDVSGCEIMNNIFSSNDQGGIKGSALSSALIIKNKFAGMPTGVELNDGCEDNYFYKNLSGVLTNPIVLNDSECTLHTPYPVSYIFNGGVVTSYLGNLWADYSGYDNTPYDGIGDTPYVVSSQISDDYPLVLDLEMYEPELKFLNVETGEDFDTLQLAIDDSDTLDWHTILICPGEYAMNATVSKSLHIVSAATDPESVTLRYDNYSQPILHVTADSVVIEGLSFSGDAESLDEAVPAILLDQVSDPNVSGNRFGEDATRVFSIGVELNEITDAVIYNNQFSYGLDSAVLIHTNSADTLVETNHMFNITSNGVRVEDSNGTIVRDNEMNGCGQAVRAQRADAMRVEANLFQDNGVGVYLNDCEQCWISQNQCIDNSTGISFYRMLSTTISENELSGNSSGIYGSSSYSNPSSNNMIYDNQINTCYEHGIFLRYCHDSPVNDNEIVDCFYECIRIENSHGGSITQNTISDGRNGILVDGSGDISIDSNTIELCGTQPEQAGINLDHGDNVTMRNNTLRDNQVGIRLFQSINATMTENVMDENLYGFGVFSGSYRDEFVHSIDSTNMINGKPMIYLVDQHDQLVPLAEGSNAGFVAMVHCSGMIVHQPHTEANLQGIVLAHTTDSIVEYGTMSQQHYGIYMHEAEGNSIYHNEISSNTFGVFLYHSSLRNMIFNNLISQNTSRGVYFDLSSSYNSIFGNDVNNNTTGIHVKGGSQYNQIFSNLIEENATGLTFESVARDNCVYMNRFSLNNYDVDSDGNSTNLWNSPVAVTYEHGGQQFTSELGNFWTSYTGADGDNDGIGDQPHLVVTGQQDDYPVVDLWGDYHRSLTIFGSYEGEPALGTPIHLLIRLYQAGADMMVDEPLITYRKLSFHNDYAGEGYDHFTELENVPVGLYKLAVRAEHSLSNQVSVDLVDGPFTVDVGMLLEGDATADEVVNLYDFGVLAGSWLASESESEYFNVMADFNYDGDVTVDDLILLCGNWLAYSGE